MAGFALLKIIDTQFEVQRDHFSFLMVCMAAIAGYLRIAAWMTGFAGHFALPTMIQGEEVQG